MPEHFIQHREYRVVGRFSADRVRELAPGPADAIKLGCPPALFERVLEKRATFRNRNTDNNRRRRLAESMARAAQLDAAIGPMTLTDDDRCARLQKSLAQAREQDTAAWLKGLL